MVIEAEIDDRDRFMLYAQEAARLVAQFGGQYVVRGAEPQLLEGRPIGEARLVISRWPDKERALAFWNSVQYAKLKQIRAGTARVRVILLEGVDEGGDAG